MKSALALVSVGNSRPANICADAELTLRAASDHDIEFLTEVFVSTRREEFTRAGLGAEQVETLLRDQFRLQHQYYHAHYPQAHFDVVVSAGTPVGRLYHAWRPPQLGDDLRVIDIAMLPLWRGRGIGTQLMHALLAGAAAEGLPVSLNVEVNNPVQRLYKRLGFVKIGTSGIYDTMRRAVAPFDLPAIPLEQLRRVPASLPEP
ncbi:GNAT family N-acetyltransferase [Burkholderia vietnamiensis]|uniref:GNAT family N-acetyltransferase n=1 Tax=Burkholderia vietnamiensis TaxID=60552 RepID=UPI00084152B3|nr:GNAT family N-acetyltransferase [Burkholderia vietnamiensis]AOJ15238.1 GCN5 family acetyltransferase [Burkholderia vietnamiensis]HDR9156408.1 GNAT family N-acetyltransferase [Burkholderia vietnamiensis]